MGLSIRDSLVAYARAVGGVYGLCFVFGMPCMWAWFIWLGCLMAYVGFLYRAVVPSPMF